MSKTLILFCFAIFSALSNPIELKISTRNESNIRYFEQLLERSIHSIDHQVNITYIGTLNYQRQISYFEANKVNVIWRMRTKERDQKYRRIDIPLTNGKIAQRLLLVNINNQNKFNNVKNLQDFIDSNSTGVFGENWYDVDVWRHNKLPYIELSGDMNKIYQMLHHGNRGFDYFSRSIIEIENELNVHPYLAIERNLIFSFDTDMYFYIQKDNDALYQLLTNALKSAAKQGIIEDLLYEFYGDLKNKYRLAHRTHITLSVPN
ncbi:hypothetical protein [Pseudoalteromonas sp.]|uniref:hypothetical protein n=1 Tax=Pseudoalteromonas sp. TaxID=53249 RepID=UPI00356757A6